MESRMRVLLMTGGSGTRLWPKSRKSMPKQFMPLGTGKTLFQQTLQRVTSLVPAASIYAVTPPEYLQHIRSQAPDIPVSRVIVEPVQHSTTACLAYAMAWLQEGGLNADDVIVVLPTDAYVGDDGKYAQSLRRAIETAKATTGIVTIGIQPNYPATGYGYIQCKTNESSNEGGRLEASLALPVKRFVEKPSYGEAVEYLNQGDYFWNVGMFIWKASTVMTLFSTLLPAEYKSLKDMAATLHAFNIESECPDQATSQSNRNQRDSGNAAWGRRIARRGTVRSTQLKSAGSRLEVRLSYGRIHQTTKWDELRAIYEKFPQQSFEFSVVQRAPEIYMVPGLFDWTDLGTWSVLLDKLGPAAASKNIVLMDAEGCLVDSQQGLVGLLGVKDLIVVNTGDTVFICHRDREQDVKKFRELLKERGYEDYL